jgi:hypothetical protein
LTSVGHFAVGERYQIGDNSADSDNQDCPFDDFQSVGMALRDVAPLLKPIHYFSALWAAISANAALRTRERSYGRRPEGPSPGHPKRTTAARAP